MFVRIVVFCAALLAAAPPSSYADSGPSGSTGSPAGVETVVRSADAPSLTLPVTLWASAVAADQMTTYWFASHHRDVLHEANPIVGPLDRHPALLVAAGSALDAATGLVVYHLLGRRHPRVAGLLFIAASTYRGYLAYHNIQNIGYASRLKAAQR